MKTMTFLLIATFASVAFAGGSGGGGVLISSIPKPKIAYLQAQEGGMIRFATGTLENGQWSIRVNFVPAAEIEQNRNLTEALLKSEADGAWVSF